MQLEPLTIERPLPRDPRPRLFEPPPVRLVTVADARLPAGAGREIELDAFYIAVLEFERDTAWEHPVYRAENFRLFFDIHEPPVERDDLRALGIEVPSLRTVEAKLIEREIEFEKQKSVMPGTQSFLLLDPAGNWIELTEGKAFQ